MTLYEINREMNDAIEAMFTEATNNSGEVSQETVDRISDKALQCYD